MRRLVPWALLGLLTIGAAAGIALGVANQPSQTPQQWLAGALATTARAGTYRVTMRETSSSSDPQVRTAITTSGMFDVVHDDAREAMVDRFSLDLGALFGSGHPEAISSRQDFVVRGRDVYIGTASNFGTGTGGREQWAEAIAPRNGPSFLTPEGSTSVTPPIPFGLPGLSPVTAVRKLGTATVGGEATTEYAVSIGPVPGCPKTKPPASSRQTVWIDPAGRIVQERSVVRQATSPLRVQHRSGSGAITSHGQLGVTPLGASSGVSSDVTTVRLFDFGAPVSIKAPSVPLRDIHRITAPSFPTKAPLCPEATVVGSTVGGETGTATLRRGS